MSQQAIENKIQKLKQNAHKLKSAGNIVANTAEIKMLDNELRSTKLEDLSLRKLEQDLKHMGIVYKGKLPNDPNIIRQFRKDLTKFINEYDISGGTNV